MKKDPVNSNTVNLSSETRLPSLLSMPLVRELGVIAAYLTGAVVFTYPLVSGLTNMVTDLADPLLNSWALAWVIHQVPRDPLHLFDANIFFPETGTLAFSERNNQLTFFEFVPAVELTGEKLFVFLETFVENALPWKEAVETGKTLPTAGKPNQGDNGLFGLKP